MDELKDSTLTPRLLSKHGFLIINFNTLNYGIIAKIGAIDQNIVKFQKGWSNMVAWLSGINICPLCREGMTGNFF